MPHQFNPTKLAVLIDGENVSSEYADELFTKVSAIGDASVRRVYGDFNGSKLNGWSKKLSLYGIVTRHQPANVPGKNSSDIALVIDAMDLLLKSGTWLNGFCIVSSDSDFSRLATSIREEGRAVFGFGGKNAPISFRSGCDTFHEFGAVSASLKTKPQPMNSSANAKSPVSEAVPILTTAVEETAGKKGWVLLPQLGSHLAINHSKFDRKRYPGSTLSGLMKLTGKFEIDPLEGKPVRVRLLQMSAES